MRSAATAGDTSAAPQRRALGVVEVIAVGHGRRSARAGGYEEQRYREGVRSYRRRVTPRLVLAVLPFVVVAVLLSWLGDGAWRWVGGVWLGAALAFFIGVRASPPEHVQRHAWGASGERRTAKVLRKLERDGWHAVHDVERRINVNVDHVLIGPKGVFMLDSKEWGGVIGVDDSGVISVTPVDDSSITRTYRGHREELQEARRVVGRALAQRARFTVPQPTPVVVFWGRFPQEPRIARGVAYVAGHQLMDWLRAQPKANLSREQIAQLVPGQATFARLMVEARLMTLRSFGSVVCRFRQAM